MDDQYLLTTPENVSISYELAGVGSRFVAALPDGPIIFAVEAGLFIMAAIASTVGPSWSAFATAAFAIALLLSFATLLGYPMLFEIVWNGQTPGKRKTGIRIVQDNGRPLTATAAIIRNVVRLVDFLPAYYIIGTVVMIIDRLTTKLGLELAGEPPEDFLARVSAALERRSWR